MADITYIPTKAGFLYLAAVIDIWSRRVVGWSMRDDMATPLVTNALDMAITGRRPDRVIHHSDRGSQYTSTAFGTRCRQAGIAISMGRRGDAYDNAVAESFFATLETELLMRTSFATRNQARSEVFDYIEGFYNPHRRHSSIGYHSPADYERSTQPPQLPSKPESRKLSTKPGQLHTLPLGWLGVRRLPLDGRQIDRGGVFYGHKPVRGRGRVNGGLAGR